jgi:hypothetical protein
VLYCVASALAKTRNTIYLHAVTKLLVDYKIVKLFGISGSERHQSTGMFEVSKTRAPFDILPTKCCGKTVLPPTTTTTTTTV